MRGERENLLPRSRRTSQKPNQIRRHLTVCRGAGSIICGPKMPPGAAPKWTKLVMMPKNKRKEVEGGGTEGGIC